MNWANVRRGSSVRIDSSIVSAGGRIPNHSLVCLPFTQLPCEKKLPSDTPKQNGLTAIELLIAISCVAVMSAFVGTIWIESRVKAEMDRAVVSVNASITAARQAARIYNTDVVLYLPANQNAPQAMYYTVPSSGVVDLLPEYEKTGLPALEGVYLVADTDTINFNSTGMAVSPVKLLLVSSTQSSVSAEVLVQ